MTAKHSGRATRALALVAALGLLGGACGSVFREPVVTVAGVRIGGIGLTGGLMFVTLNVVNPNGFDLEADGLTYDLDIADPQGADSAWVDFAEGTYTEDIEVRGDGSAEVEIPVEFTYRSLGSVIRSLLERGTFRYRVRGTVELEKPLDRDVPFRKEGLVTMSGAR